MRETVHERSKSANNGNGRVACFIGFRLGIAAERRPANVRLVRYLTQYKIDDAQNDFYFEISIQARSIS